MAAIVGIAAHLRAVPTPHVWLKFVDRRGLRSPDVVQGNSLVRVAAKASDFEIAVTSIEGVAQRRRWLRRTAITEHALVPRFACKFVGLFAGSGGAFSRRPDR